MGARVSLTGSMAIDAPNGNALRRNETARRFEFPSKFIDMNANFGKSRSFQRGRNSAISSKTHRKRAGWIVNLLAKSTVDRADAKPAGAIRHFLPELLGKVCRDRQVQFVGCHDLPGGIFPCSSWQLAATGWNCEPVEPKKLLSSIE